MQDFGRMQPGNERLQAVDGVFQYGAAVIIRLELFPIHLSAAQVGLAVVVIIHFIYNAFVLFIDAPVLLAFVRR